MQHALYAVSLLLCWARRGFFPDLMAPANGNDLCLCCLAGYCGLGDTAVPMVSSGDAALSSLSTIFAPML
jgi:hypothetical protein